MIDTRWMKKTIKAAASNPIWHAGKTEMKAQDEESEVCQFRGGETFLFYILPFCGKICAWVLADHILPLPSFLKTCFCVEGESYSPEQVFVYYNKYLAI